MSFTHQKKPVLPKTILGFLKNLESIGYTNIPFFKFIVWRCAHEDLAINKGFDLITHTVMYDLTNNLSWSKYLKAKAN